MQTLAKLFTILALFFVNCPTLSSQTYPLFQEEGGLLVIEAESSHSLGQWSPETSITPFTGNSYLLYTGPNLFNDPGSSKMTYQIIISTPGKYRFRWRSRIAIGESNTEHNDSWLRFPDAADFYGEKGTERVYPRGVGKTPNPEGSSKDGWLKVYQNRRNDWTWNASTSDRDPHHIFVEFDTAGTYQLEIAGRSNGHAIDRVVLYHSSVAESFAINTIRPESVNLNPISSSVQLEEFPIRVLPNPASEALTISVPKNFEPGLSQIRIFNASGQVVKQLDQRMAASSMLNISIQDFPTGIYWLIITNKKQLLRSRFVKK